MRYKQLLFCLLAMNVIPAPGAAAEPGGTISIGEDTWMLVAATQCAVYPGNIVSVSGYAAEDQSLEIVIDYGGPTGVRVGEGPDAWHAQKESISVQIEGKRLQGTATFLQYSGGPESTRQGRFDISCG